MLTYQCNVCKQSITLAEEEQIGVCPRCGSLFVVPNQFRDNANKRNIYRLADEALANRNFDVALTYYKRILMVDAKEPAAHWGFLRSKYGVELSQRAETYEHVIFHRLEREIFTDDPSYETMITYCPKKALYYYQGLSRFIAEQQKKMLRIAQDLQPYDIYLNCTAGPGTADYLLANQVGYALDQAGYRVFLPATMLANTPEEDKNLYEMAVAETAQTMIVVATASTDYDNARYLAAWKRFLAYRRQDAGRKMLSVFQSILPEQLPMELQPLQSIKCDGQNFQDEVLNKINEMFGRKNQDASVTRQILDYLRQADEQLAAGNYTQASALFRNVRQLDAEEARAHWGLVCADTKNLTTPVFSPEVSTNYQRALQFAQGAQRAQYQKVMCALMAEPAWKQLMQLTGNLTKIQTLSQKPVQTAIANVREYLAKDDPRLRKIEEFYAADKAHREAIALKSAYERRDVLVEPLFEEQGKAENAYKACGHAYTGLIGPFNRTSNLLILSILLMVAGQLSLTKSFTHSVHYEGGAYILSAVLFFAAAIVAAVVIARILRLIADELDWAYSFGVLAAAAILIASFFLFRAYTKTIFLIYLAIITLLWLVLRIVTGIMASSIRSNAGLLKKAAKQVLLVNEQIHESYVAAMRAHFDKYGMKNAEIPDYTVSNSSGFYIQPEVKKVPRMASILISAVVILALIVTGTTWFSNRQYASGWENIVSLSSGGYHIVGLREDGTCVANGRNNDGQCNVSTWENVTQISAGRTFTAALLEDGTVLVACNDEERFAAVEKWTDIVQIDASNDHVLGLKKDGTCVAVGSNGFGESEVSGWADIKVIRAVTNGNGSISIGVNGSGKILATAMSDWDGIREHLSNETGSEEGQLKVTTLYGEYGSLIGSSDDNVYLRFGANNNNQLSESESWDTSTIKQVHIGNFTVGLRHDGTVLFAGNDSSSAAQISAWKNIKSVTGSANHALGLRKDGTVCSAGNNEQGQCTVDQWEDIQVIYAGDLNSYGIRGDGTVEAVGYSLGGLTYLSPKNPLELLEFWLSV